MIKGARQLPTMHVSVRVPWHDSRWAGTVCANPRGNTSCLILPRIAETKDDEFESGIAGEPWDAEASVCPPARQSAARSWPLSAIAGEPATPTAILGTGTASFTPIFAKQSSGTRLTVLRLYHSDG